MLLFINLLCLLNLLPNSFDLQNDISATQAENTICLLSICQTSINDDYIRTLHPTHQECMNHSTAMIPLTLVSNIYERLVERLEYLWEWMDTYRKKNREDLFMHHSKLPVYFGLFFGLLLIIIVVTINNKQPSTFLMCSLFVVFFALCGCEILQFLGYHGDHTWFCTINKVGWLLTILNFVLFAAITLSQMFAMHIFLTYLDAYTNRDCNWLMSLFIVGIGFVLFFLGSAFSKTLFVYGGILFIISQICWVIWLIYANIIQHGNWLNLLVAYFIYLIGGFCIFITLAHLVSLVFLVAIFALFLIPRGSGHTPTIYVKGEGHITGRGYNGGVNFHGDNGHEYEYDGKDWGRKY